MRYLTTLYLADHRAKVASRDGALLVQGGDGKKTRVPSEAIEAVVLASRAQITNDAMALCVSQHIRVTCLSSGGRVRFVVSGGIGGNVLLRLAQHRAFSSDGERRRIASWIVAGKLANCRRMIDAWASDATVGERRVMRRLERQIVNCQERLPGTTAIDQMMGLEGAGSRAYFVALQCHLRAHGGTRGFHGRNRRPPRDPANALMSYCYGLLVSEAVGALDAIGLDPQIGFLHGVRPGRPSLALDLIEEMRPSVADRFAVGTLTRNYLRDDDFSPSHGGAVFLSDQGRRNLFSAYEEYRSAEVYHPLLERNIPRSALLVSQATLLARYVRGDIPAYPPYVMAS